MKRILYSLLLLAGCLSIRAQVPQGFNYQAIARDNSGNPVAGATIEVKLGILSDTLIPTIVREELFTNVKTNSFGLFTLVIGTGTYQAGSTVNFSDINWTAKTLYLRTYINYPIGTWKYMGTSKLYSVPYSIIAKDLGGSVSRLKVAGTDVSMDSALFEVRNNTGQIVFAVYNEGVRIYVDDGVAKATTKGGFAIGGFGTGKTTSQPLFVVNPDSIRAYIGTNPTKGIKGGFAIGGFNTNKAPGEEYLRVTRDSSRIFIREPAKGIKGGFAIGSFNTAKGGVTYPFTSLTPDNYLIGHNSGKSITTGVFNSFLGYESGFSNTTGLSNAFFGYQSGYSNLDGDNNLFLGYQSGYNNVTGDYNSFLGYHAGYSNTSGVQNSFLGSYSGANNGIGSNNTFIGYNSGFTNSTGSSNSFIGNGSGYSNLSGNYNIFIGPNSGSNNVSGSYNIFIGALTGGNSTGGYENIFMGYRAGFSNLSGHDNTFLGHEAGFTNNDGTGNMFIGVQTGYSNTSGSQNIFFGNASGYSNTSGGSNVFLGTESGTKNTIGTGNVFVGRASGWRHISGDNNIYIGLSAAQQEQTGQNNTIIGARAGEFTNNRTGDVFIGYKAGSSESYDNRLIIANTDTKNLVYGDFANDWVIVNNKLGINVSQFLIGSWALNVNGTMKLGPNGTTINEFIRGSYTLLAAGDISGDQSYKFEFTLSGAAIGASVIASPRTELPDGIVVSYSRVKAANTVEIKLQNTRSSTVSMISSIIWDVTLIQ